MIDLDLGIAEPTSVIIILLLPLTAGMLVTQTNPYHALVVRAIVGAIAALIYALFGAADVALTEALVGTLLSMMLYIVAVRSSMTLRVGYWFASQATEADTLNSTDTLEPLLQILREQIHPYHLRLEVIPYATREDLESAYEQAEIHTLITPQKESIWQIQTRQAGLESVWQHPSLLNLATIHAMPTLLGDKK